MDKNELALILKNMYENAEQGEKVAMIHLFGMKYSKEIKELSSANEIVKLASLKDLDQCLENLTADMTGVKLRKPASTESESFLRPGYSCSVSQTTESNK